MTAEYGTAKRARKRLCYVGTVVIVIVAVIVYFTLTYKSVDEQLAEIEAARAIPDSENAAIIYNKLLEDSNAASPTRATPEFLNADSSFKPRWEPWRSTDYPELAAWVNEHQHIIETLLEAAQFEKCRFPIVIDVQSMTRQGGRITVMRKWAYLLRFAANNDIAEGRTDDAIAKWRCLARMAGHLRQQPSWLDHILAIGIDSIALQLAAVYIVEGDAVEMRLRQIESIGFDTKDTWAAHTEQIGVVEDLAMQKLKEEFGPLEHVKYLFNYGIYGMAKPSDINVLRYLHLRDIATKRGTHILIALRRHKNKHGAWPQSLNEIGAHILPEALIGPFNDGPFIYRLTETGFELSSTGKDKPDEHGKHKDPFDDWSIWPMKPA